MMGSSMQRMLCYGLCRGSRRQEPMTAKELRTHLANLRVDAAVAEAKLALARDARRQMECRAYGHVPAHRDDYPARMWS